MIQNLFIAALLCGQLGNELLVFNTAMQSSVMDLLEKCNSEDGESEKEESEKEENRHYLSLSNFSNHDSDLQLNPELYLDDLLFLHHAEITTPPPKHSVCTISKTFY